MSSALGSETFRRIRPLRSGVEDPERASNDFPWISRRPFDYFAGAVTISGDVVMVGLLGDTDSCLPDTPYGECGSVYVYRLNSGDWIEEAKLTASEPVAIAHFGMSVSLSDDVAVIGAPFDQTEGNILGSTYVFSFDSGQWLE
ncbi:MAG: FG-GAP repeat protein [Planctomycetes bacterium]|nr:FG-GAP repeat protein [Planctomycetota bacterium]